MKIGQVITLKKILHVSGISQFSALDSQLRFFCAKKRSARAEPSLSFEKGPSDTHVMFALKPIIKAGKHTTNSLE